MAKDKVKMVNKEQKLQFIFKIVLGVFILIFSFLAWNFVTQDKYAFVLNFKWLKSDADIADIKITMDWLIDLYTAFFLALIGLYFTIIGIGFSLKQISILVFYEFTFLTPISLSTFIVFVLNAVSIYCVLPNLRLTNTVVVYIFFSIVFCITVFCYFSSRIFYTDDEVWARQLFYYLFRKKRKNINKFINKFLIKSFEKESPFVFFNTNDPNSVANEIFFETVSIDEINDLKAMENFMIVVSSKIKECINKLDEDKQAEICIKYITVFDKFYRHYLFKLHSDTSFILYIRDAFWLAGNSTKSEKFFELYAIACKNIKDIVLTSFYQKTDETIFAYLNDYRYLNQLPLFYSNKKFNALFNRTLVEISTYMFDIVAVGRHSNEIIPYAEKLFLSLEKIDVDCVAPVMYSEGAFSDIRVHEVKYTQEFLVVLILFYLMTTNPDFDMKELLKNKIRFVNYSFKEDENPLNLLKMGYSRFMSCIEKISREEINNIKTISESDFNDTKERFSSLLNGEITKINEKYKTELKATISDEKLNEFVNSEKSRLLDDLKLLFSEVDDTSSYRNKTIEIGYDFLFSQKAYKESNKVIHVESFSHFVLEWFVQIYISHCNLKYFKTFSELNFEKDSNLLLHIDYMYEVFDDKTIERGIGSFGVNGNEFKTTYFRNGKRGLIYESDFKRHFAIKEIIPLMDQKETEERDDDILVRVPVKIVFCEMDENPDFWILSK